MRWGLLLGLLALLALALWAENDGESNAPRVTPRPALPARPKRLNMSALGGTVLSDGVPVDGAEVFLKLRNALDTDSCPLSGEEVVARHALGTTTLARTRTDRAGRFHFDELLGGPYLLVARSGVKVGFLTEVSSGDLALHVALFPPGTLAGRVLDEEDHPIAGARVVVLGEAGEMLERDTEQDGGFRVTAPHGLYRVVAWAPGLAPAVTVARPRRPIALQLGRERRFSGTVLDGEAEASSVSLQLASPWCSVHFTSDARGRFDLRGLPPERYRLVASNGARETRQSLSLETGDVREAEIRLDSEPD